jgi:hypothetical protein
LKSVTRQVCLRLSNSPQKEFKQASSQGFSILAGYILEEIKRNEKIAMTSPVTMSLEDSMTVMFMVPKN